MDIKDIDKIIEEVIKEMYKSQPKSFSIFKFLITRPPHDVDSTKLNRIIEIIEDKELIRHIDDGNNELTRFGKDIVEAGGWKKHLKRKKMANWSRVVSIYIYPLVAIIIACYSAYLGRTSSAIESRLNLIENKVTNIESNQTRIPDFVDKIKLMNENVLRLESELDSIHSRITLKK
jgi:hypothetical protein